MQIIHMSTVLFQIKQLISNTFLFLTSQIHYQNFRPQVVDDTPRSVARLDYSSEFLIN